MTELGETAGNISVTPTVTPTSTGPIDEGAQNLNHLGVGGIGGGYESLGGLQYEGDYVNNVDNPALPIAESDEFGPLQTGGETSLQQVIVGPSDQPEDVYIDSFNAELDLYLEKNNYEFSQAGLVRKQIQFAHDFPGHEIDEALAEFIESTRTKTLEEMKEEYPDFEADNVFVTEEQIAQASDNQFRRALDEKAISPAMKARILYAHYHDDAKGNLTDNEAAILAEIETTIAPRTRAIFGAPDDFPLPVDTYYMNDQISYEINDMYEGLLQDSGLSPEEIKVARYLHYNPDAVGQLTDEQKSQFASVLSKNENIHTSINETLTEKYGLPSDWSPPDLYQDTFNVILTGDYMYEFEQNLIAHAQEHGLTAIQMQQVRNAHINPNDPSIPEDIRELALTLSAKANASIVDKYQIPTEFNPLGSTKAVNFQNIPEELKGVFNTIGNTEVTIESLIAQIEASDLDAETKTLMLDFLKSVLEALADLKVFMFMMMAADSAKAKKMTESELDMKLTKIDNQKLQIEKQRKKIKKMKKKKKEMKGLNAFTDTLMIISAAAIGFAMGGPVGAAMGATLATALVVDRRAGGGQLEKLFKKIDHMMPESMGAFGRFVELYIKSAIVVGLTAANPAVGLDVMMQEASLVQDIMGFVGIQDDEAQMWTAMVVMIVASIATGRLSAKPPVSNSTFVAQQTTVHSTKTTGQLLKTWAKASVASFFKGGAQRSDELVAIKQAFYQGSRGAKAYNRFLMTLDALEFSSSTAASVTKIQMNQMEIRNVKDEQDFEEMLAYAEEALKIIRKAIQSLQNLFKNVAEDAANVDATMSKIHGDLSKLTSEVNAATHG